MFGEYLIARQGAMLPPVDPGNFYEYILAANGVFVRASREEFQAMVLVAPCHVSGLEKLDPYVNLNGGRLPQTCTQAILADFRAASPMERLLWVILDGRTYTVYAPPQIALASKVAPVDPQDPMGVNAFMDIHSHGRFPAGFSLDDDQDELRHRMRIFAVIGTIEDAPQVLVRVVIHGHEGYFPAASIMELPEGVKDCLYEN